MRFSTWTKSLLCATVIDLASAISVAEEIAPHLGVHVDTVHELMNTTDFESLDATKWAVTFDQPAHVLAAWSPETKMRMFSTLQELLYIEPANNKRANTQAQINAADADIKGREQKVLKEVTDDEQQDKVRCTGTTNCVLCIGAAGAAGVGVIASCSATALGEEALTAAPTAGWSTAVVIATWVACVAKPVAAFLVATGICLKTTT
ncbi:hypothetical protein ColLi_06638 [Colletotrichum liriopes]|uniref:Uncharacterized protein n=1 Tax=Colletotrichum liriopes TaxID=708192 RepID=A0AA37LSI5_9PEZI|nr:hypothetical protein ColLi_06638 [Colletotrichum liriopes]